MERGIALGMTLATGYAAGRIAEGLGRPATFVISVIVVAVAVWMVWR